MNASSSDNPTVLFMLSLSYPGISSPLKAWLKLDTIPSVASASV
jgi:hypothetical protein